VLLGFAVHRNPALMRGQEFLDARSPGCGEIAKERVDPGQRRFRHRKIEAMENMTTGQMASSQELPAATHLPVMKRVSSNRRSRVPTLISACGRPRKSAYRGEMSGSRRSCSRQKFLVYMPMSRVLSMSFSLPQLRTLGVIERSKQPANRLAPANGVNP